MSLKTEIHFEAELSQATQTVTIPNVLIVGDANAYEIVVDILRDGEPVDLAGSKVTGVGIMGSLSAFAEGSASGNTARFTMTDDFFYKSGTMYVLVTVEMDDVIVTPFRGVVQVLKSAKDTSILNNEAFPAAALMEAAKNEEERIASELFRQSGYEEILATYDTAKAVLSAGMPHTVEEDEGYISFSYGMEYDAYAADEAIKVSVNNVNARVDATDDRADAIVDAIALMEANKVDAYQGVAHSGKALVVGQTGYVETTDTTVFDMQAKAVYPVGSIYTTESNRNPAELFGGTWVEITDVMLRGAGTDEAGAVGGHESSKLTLDMLPLDIQPMEVNDDV